MVLTILRELHIFLAIDRHQCADGEVVNRLALIRERRCVDRGTVAPDIGIDHLVEGGRGLRSSFGAGLVGEMNGEVDPHGRRDDCQRAKNRPNPGEVARPIGDVQPGFAVVDPRPGRG